MKGMIVYDSIHGNTEQVAQAIAGALGTPEEIETRRVAEVNPERLTELDVLIVSAPTHAFRPSPAAREFLQRIPAGALEGVTVAAFDTRMSVEDAGSAVFGFFVRFFGYAAKPIADRLKWKGGDLALPPEGFFVEGAEGPLKEGELKRAADWAERILAA